ncbi:hypothetical protein GGR56DRAFT_674772 [Xylariaceae sp. FL0804]|nr:hypothetical protein GGR56DRAFT_674772 [Xylariaceae sp. FL0804]
MSPTQDWLFFPNNNRTRFYTRPTSPSRLAPYPVPGPGELVVRNSAVAINPIDGYKQAVADAVLGHVVYPFIPGGDVDGTLVEVGASTSASAGVEAEAEAEAGM